MGGVDAELKPLNDVWQSDNCGDTWRLLPCTKAKWEGRSSFGVAVLPGNVLLVMGGWRSQRKESDPHDFGSVLHDVWRSTDGGCEWIQLPDAPWAGRSSFGVAVLPQGYCLIYGGILNDYDSYQNDIWQTTDGKQWSRLAEAPWWPRCYHSAVVIPEGPVLIFGGECKWQEKTWHLNDVWQCMPPRPKS